MPRFTSASQRLFVAVFLMAVAMTGLSSALATSATGATGDRPHIILCMADDQGWGDVAYNGHPYLKTPNLDAMSRAGLRFDRFYAAAPVCTPTRASVMTGRHPNRMAAFQWGHSLRPQEVTIAEALQEAGYVTGHFGKWHLGSVQKTSPVNPGNSGFHHWVSAYNFYDNDPILSNEGVATPIKGESSIVAVDAAIDFIRGHRNDGDPMFCVIWFGSPHSPFRSVDEDMKPYKNNKNAGPWAGEITGLDRAMGKLRQALRVLKLHENTLLWYCSDNGGLRSESSGGRGKKGSVYEGGLRVPGIIEWPAKLKPRVTNVLGNTADIYPTLLDIIGHKVKDQPVLDGISLRPLLEGKMTKRDKPMGFWHYPAGGIRTPSDAWMKDLLAAQKSGDEVGDKKRLYLDAGKIKPFRRDNYRGHSAWLDWPWKLHRIGGNRGGVKFELYNLAEDGMEKNDLLMTEPDRAKAMQVSLKTWLDSVIGSLNGEDYKP